MHVKNIKTMFLLFCVVLLMTGCTQKEVDIREDGTYYVEVSLEGGSGKVTIESPAKVEVLEESRVAYIKWSSPNYDYMIVDGQKYFPVNTEGNSEFRIPIKEFDVPVSVIADTTAMSVPHEIEYQLTLHSDSVMLAKDTPMARAKYSVYVAIGIMILCIVVSRVKLIRKKKRMAEMIKDD